MKSYSSREIIKLLKQDGWYEVNVTGSHHQFKHPTKKGRTTIKHPDKDSIRGLIDSQFQDTVYHPGKVEGPGTSSSQSYPQSRTERMNACVLRCSTLSFHSTQDPSLHMVPSTFRVALPATVNQRLVSTVSPDPIPLTTKLYHHRPSRNPEVAC